MKNIKIELLEDKEVKITSEVGEIVSYLSSEDGYYEDDEKIVEAIDIILHSLLRKGYAYTTLINALKNSEEILIKFRNMERF